MKSLSTMSYAKYLFKTVLKSAKSQGMNYLQLKIDFIFIRRLSKKI